MNFLCGLGGLHFDDEGSRVDEPIELDDEVLGTFQVFQTVRRSWSELCDRGGMPRPWLRACEGLDGTSVEPDAARESLRQRSVQRSVDMRRPPETRRLRLVTRPAAPSRVAAFVAAFPAEEAAKPFSKMALGKKFDDFRSASPTVDSPRKVLDDDEFLGISPERTSASFRPPRLRPPNLPTGNPRSTSKLRSFLAASPELAVPTSSDSPLTKQPSKLKDFITTMDATDKARQAAVKSPERTTEAVA